MIRYILLKPGPEPYISSYSKRSPFKTKLCSVQSLALMYSVEDQQADRQARMLDPMSASSEVDLIGEVVSTHKTYTIDVKNGEENEVNELLT